MSISRKLLSGLFALLILGVHLSFSIGEEPSYQEEGQDQLMDIFKTDYSISPTNYSNLYEYKYVSADGLTEKWYCSYMPKIDGLTRSDNPDDISSTDHWDYAKGKQCDILEEQAYLYCGPVSLYFKPNKPE